MYKKIIASTLLVTTGFSVGASIEQRKEAILKGIDTVIQKKNTSHSEAQKELQGTIEELKQQLKEKSTQLENSNSDNTQLQKEVEELKQQIATLERQLKESNSSNESVNSSVDSAFNDIKDKLNEYGANIEF